MEGLRTTAVHATLTSTGHLAAWQEESDREGELTRVTLAVDEVVRWSTTAPDGTTADGTFPSPGPILWLPAGGPALLAWPVGDAARVWDGRRVVSGTLRSREDLGATTQLRVDADGPWELLLDAAGDVEGMTAPDGTTIQAGGTPPEPYDPVILLRHPAPHLPDARRLRRLEVLLPDGRRVLVARPLMAEIPRDVAATTRSPEAPSPETVPLGVRVPEPRPLPLPPATTRLELLASAHAAVAAEAANTRTSPDCKALARRLAGALRAAGVPAEEVHGVVWQDGPAGPAFVRHAWVRVDFGPALPWLHTDPALGQLVADATHVSDAELGRLTPGAPLVVVEAIGPHGPVAVGEPAR